MNGVMASTKRFIPLTAVLGVSIVSICFFIFLAKRSDIERQNFYKTQKELQLYRTGIWHLEKLAPTQLEKQLARMKAQFPPAENLAVLIEELTKLANHYDLSIVSITPSEQAEVREEKSTLLSVFGRIPIDIRLEGNYEGLASFLSELSTLEHGIIKVDRFRLEKLQNNSTRLMLSLESSLYVKKVQDQDILAEPISVNVPLERQAGKSRFNAVERNPFTKASIGAIATAESQINLEGIIYDPAQPMILINGETKGVGDTVHHMKIIKIEPDSVLFEKGSERVRMRLRRN